ncbi:bifunctional protein-serine/threonine kinase/phosphatase [Acidithiobacillus caldus]|uniref:bifunctional protein-serine/threonine kinase/phosphatase n=1 Tax=Acidithiobacillus caldus TaxID=33059 RepID=UPI001C062335|nr:bifunctional protein-serine/threonine kinase/phosphatase [Acidithiobacillus caldus]MBU2731136.1 bifunctional protein-serine/threonine kinase/phosphatase [Acidithiobacillus caldus]MBU2735983.1 bifunctional protein-serine/threonine kinase/phosphatase [Acidithiobacillus caldus ATCC 51756]MBU2744229.1 bifunctional protein-serine/threonine kinase/phosphatase [Acidithiobacillus caldus]MBU2779294.1 bifunctional protein-serine/threonine kinase/phosphatase [Acidithiobacillus caldus]
MKKPYRDTFEINYIKNQSYCRVAHYSISASQNKTNQDYIAYADGGASLRQTRGNIWVLADGMSGGKAGRVAAELFVRQLIDGYTHLSPTISIASALGRAVDAANRSIHWLSRNDPNLAGMATVFCAIVMRGWEFYACYAGDVHCYRWRNRNITLLTVDHTIKAMIGNIVYRAAGMNDVLNTDFHKLDIEQDDIIILMSDGCYRYLKEREIREIMISASSLADAAEKMANSAIVNGSQDDVTIGLLEVLWLPSKTMSIFEHEFFSIPIGRPPNIGANIDGYHILEHIYDGYQSVLFRSFDEKSNTEKVLKFPKRQLNDDDAIRRTFATEDWVSSIVSSPWLVRTAHDGRCRSQVYTVMLSYKGQNLSMIIRSKTLTVREGLEIMKQLAKAVYALHKLNIIHRDIKPDNVFITDRGDVLLLDYGFALVPGTIDQKSNLMLGTLAYMAPEIIAGAPGDSRSDVYSLGVTFYYMFSRWKPPIDAEGYRSLRRYRPDIPDWLDRVIKKMVSANPRDRYSDTLEVLYDIESQVEMFGLEGVQKKSKLIIREVVLLRVVVLLLIIIIFGSSTF